MLKLIQKITVIAVFGMLSAPASAATINLSATLEGSQEVPPNASPATGTGTMVYDDISNLLSWTSPIPQTR